jgi:phosphatidylglycerophosphatase C
MGETVAVFDLDGTITRRDSYVGYLLFYLRRHPRRWPRGVAVAAAGALFAAGAIGNTAMKTLALRGILAGAERGEIARWSERFAAACAASMLRPGALRRIEAHRQAGHRLVLATAGLDIYAEPLARRLGFARTLCTRVAWTEAGRLSGDLDGGNLRGEQKLAAVRQALAADGGEGQAAAPFVIAYSDHHSDLPLLRWADRGVAVNPTARLASAAAAAGMAIENWDRS